jgi:hypothetical protein
MATESTLTWTEIEVDTLDEGQQLAYAEYKDAQRKAAKLRAEFEAMMQAGVPDGQRMVFGYRFGKLSVALAPKDEAKAKAKQPKLGLADFLKLQGANGHAA